DHDIYIKSQLPTFLDEIIYQLTYITELQAFHSTRDHNAKHCVANEITPIAHLIHKLNCLFGHVVLREAIQQSVKSISMMHSRMTLKPLTQYPVCLVCTQGTEHTMNQRS